MLTIEAWGSVPVNYLGSVYQDPGLVKRARGGAGEITLQASLKWLIF